MRNITNVNNILSSRSIDNGGDLNSLTADLPLNLVLDDTTNDSINLGGLNSYGTSGQVIKVNSNNDGLEYADDNNTEYTVVTPLTISNNAISLSNLTNFGGAGKILKVNINNNAFEYANEQDISGFITASSTDTLTNKSISYNQLTTPPISNDGLSNTKLIQFRNSGSPARAIEFANSAGAYRHTVEHTNNGLQFYAGNSSTGINLTQIINISTTGLKIQRIEMIENTDSFNVLMFNSATGLIAKSRSTYIMPSSSGTLALTSDIPDSSSFVTISTLPNLVAGLTTFGSDSAGLTNFGATNYSTNLYGNVTIKNITTVNSGNLYVYGSGGLITASTYNYTFPQGNGTLVSSVTLPPSVSILNNFGTIAIGIVSLSKYGLDTLIYGNVKLQNTINATSGNILLYNTGGLVNKSTLSYTLPSSTGTLALTSDLTDFITTESLPLLVDSLTIFGSDSASTTNFGATNHDTNLFGNVKIANISTSTNDNMLVINSSGLVKKSVQSFTLPTSGGTLALTSNIPTATTFGSNSGSATNFGATNYDTNLYGNVKIRNISPSTAGNILILGANQSVTSIAQIPISSIALINYWNIAYRPFDVDYTNLSMVALYAIFTKPITNVNLFIGDGNFKYRHNIRHTTSSIGFYISTNNDYTTGNINSFNITDTGCSTDRINFTNPSNNLYSRIDHGGAYGHGPDIMGHTGVKLWARDGNNTNDVRFYVLSSLVNMRVPIAYLNGSLVQTSDDRLKTDEIDFTFNSLEIINKMKPKQYKKYNENGEFLYMELGMVAQDTWNTVKDNDILKDIFVGDVDYNLESNFKENGDLVEDQQKINDEGEIVTNYLYVNYISYVPILIQSVKDLNTIVKQQQEQINKQQVIIDKLVNSTTYKNFKSSI